MMQMSRCIQHPSPQQVELRTTIANALDHFQSIHLRFELAIRPWLLERRTYRCFVAPQTGGKPVKTEEWEKALTRDTVLTP